MLREGFVSTGKFRPVHWPLLPERTIEGPNRRRKFPHFGPSFSYSSFWNVTASLANYNSMDRGYTIELDPQVYERLEEESREERRNISELANDVLRRHSFA